MSGTGAVSGSKKITCLQRNTELMSMLKAGATNAHIIQLTGAKAKAPAAYEYNLKHGRHSQNRPLPQKNLLIMSACMLFFQCVLHESGGFECCWQVLVTGQAQDPIRKAAGIKVTRPEFRLTRSPPAAGHEDSHSYNAEKTQTMSAMRYHVLVLISSLDGRQSHLEEYTALY